MRKAFGIPVGLSFRLPISHRLLVDFLPLGQARRVGLSWGRLWTFCNRALVQINNLTQVNGKFVCQSVRGGSEASLGDGRKQPRIGLVSQTTSSSPPNGLAHHNFINKYFLGALYNYSGCLCTHPHTFCPLSTATSLPYT